ncbi:DUF4244 domain-containing protein [Arthrobacter agilis]|uniref:DUF4244 domain-containing protein n=1 Tax=Arthrobacter agilis TaxID=37921 RepID=UPI0027D81431|nr:DUF4244 domain-containing protein [Arthrobacter agilis]
MFLLPMPRVAGLSTYPDPPPGARRDSARVGERRPSLTPRGSGSASTKEMSWQCDRATGRWRTSPSGIRVASASASGTISLGRPAPIRAEPQPAIRVRSEGARFHDGARRGRRREEHSTTPEVPVPWRPSRWSRRHRISRTGSSRFTRSVQAAVPEVVVQEVVVRVRVLVQEGSSAAAGSSGGVGGVSVYGSAGGSNPAAGTVEGAGGASAYGSEGGSSTTRGTTAGISPGATPVDDRAARRAETRRRRSNQRAIRHRRDPSEAEAGMATAEYAIATLAAVGFAALLVAVLSSGEVKGLLMSLITSALNFG